MVGTLPWSPEFQTLLNSIGWVLARLYDVSPNFGLSIIVLTIAIRVVLVPLGVKQIKSMQAMQAIQPKVKELQKKYKGNKQRAQEETMKLYREHGVSPLGGCLPVLLQFPFLIAMYAVIRPPQLVAATQAGQAVYEIHNNHLPVDSALFQHVVTHTDLSFVGLKLECSAGQAGTSATIVDTKRQPVIASRPLRNSDGAAIPGLQNAVSRASQDCGSSATAKIPYLVFIAAMIGSQFYQQKQMQRVSPPGASSQQQQTLLYLMPLMFGFWGWLFPSGLVVYWVAANLWQIGQQYVLFRMGHIGPEALERRRQELASRPPVQRKGFISSLMQRADDERKRRDTGASRRTPSSGQDPKPSKPNPAKRSGPAKRPNPQKRKPPGGAGGASGANDGKDRPKR